MKQIGRGANAGNTEEKASNAHTQWKADRTEKKQIGPKSNQHETARGATQTGSAIKIQNQRASARTVQVHRRKVGYLNF